MKKSVLFFMLVGFPALCYCQLWNPIGEETVNDKTRFGIILGINISKVQVDFDAPGFEQPGYKPGFISGIYLQSRINKNIIFQPALLLVNKGMKENYQYGSNRSILSYVEVPLNVLYKPISTKGSFFIGVGPAPSFNIGQTLLYSGSTELKRIDLGINMLTGYEIPIGFSLNLNYTHGLVNISGVREYMPVFRNRSFGIAVGYTF